MNSVKHTGSFTLNFWMHNNDWTKKKDVKRLQNLKKKPAFVKKSVPKTSKAKSVFLFKTAQLETKIANRKLYSSRIAITVCYYQSYNSIFNTICNSVTF